MQIKLNILPISTCLILIYSDENFDLFASQCHSCRRNMVYDVIGGTKQTDRH
jgi:hypothetical protein